MDRSVHPHPLLACVGHGGVGEGVHHDAAALRRPADRLLAHEWISRERRAESVKHADRVRIILGEPDRTRARWRRDGERLRLRRGRVGRHDTGNPLVGETAVKAPDRSDDVAVARLRDRHGEGRTGGSVEPLHLEVPPAPETRAEAGVAVIVAHRGGDPPRVARSGDDHACRVDVHRLAGQDADQRLRHGRKRERPEHGSRCDPAERQPANRSVLLPSAPMHEECHPEGVRRVPTPRHNRTVHPAEKRFRPPNLGSFHSASLWWLTPFFGPDVPIPKPIAGFTTRVGSDCLG